jgi:hypothetical protein
VIARQLVLVAAVALGAILGACSGGAPADDGTTPETFLAFSSTFADFRKWESFHSDGPAAGTQPPDVLGPRTQYLNKRPPKGSTEFPVGTIIVEAREFGSKLIFAGVKRGGGFNAGAPGWEWFELSEAADGTVSIVWRGVGPPNGETYGGDPNGCNSCHAGCGAGNDFICSSKLKLTEL